MIDTFTVVNGDTIAVNGQAMNKTASKQEPLEKKEPKFILNLSEEMFSHLHNKMVHFPIALAFAAFLSRFAFLSCSIFSSTSFFSSLFNDKE